MAKIQKADQLKIYESVAIEGLKVADLAAQFGCTSQNIYSIVARLRRERTEQALPLPLSIVNENTVASEPHVPVADLFAAPAEPEAAMPPPAPPPTLPPSSARPARPPVKAPALKSGMGLKMRTPEGEDSIVPFKSIEDLLSGIKPYLRDAARAPEPMWFCLERIDLAAFDPEG